jgi:uncharacterized coiled-coil protein SlyX|tara:strand:- start:761 stop:919 length:159 start_codon:yes stop_codon:yes gene_type:complete
MILQFPIKKEPNDPIEYLNIRVTSQKEEIETQAKQITALAKRLELQLKDQKQ